MITGKGRVTKKGRTSEEKDRRVRKGGRMIKVKGKKECK